MLNIKQKVVGKKLILEIDLSKEFGESKSGKSIIIASTQGNKPVDAKPEITFGLNIYRKVSG